MSFRPLCRQRRILLTVLTASLVSTAAYAEDFETKLQANLNVIAADLPAPVRTTLARIDGVPRQLLATRTYLRSADELATRWSWSAAQIAAYERSDDYRDMLATIERVRQRFEADNPGYTLYANTQVRSLDVQIERWNHNPSVEKVANELQQALAHEFGADAKTRDATGEANRFRTYLRTWTPSRAAPLAAPGMSLHGQSRAIDFQISKGGRVVAATDTASVKSAWETQGWSRKLEHAIAAAEGRFVGPLRSPNEPWHYEYLPARNAQQTMNVAAK